MGLEYFPCYHSYAKKCEKLSDQELGRLFRALMVFSETGERQELAGRECIAFDFIADDIQRSKDAYDAKCQKNADNASKRYSADGCERTRTDANGCDGSKNKDKDKTKSKDKDKSESIIQARFTPPERDEVVAYCNERGYQVNVDAWFAHYESNGWKVGRNQMKDWKAAIRTWTHSPYENKKTNAQPKQYTTKGSFFDDD